MKSISTLAVAVSLAIGLAGAADPAFAQKKKKAEAAAAPVQPVGWRPTFAPGETEVLTPIETAIIAQDWATAATLLEAARPKITSPDGLHFYGRFQLQIGTGTNNRALQSQGIDSMVASGGGDPTKMASIYRDQVVLALEAKDYAKAEAGIAKWSQMAPNELEVTATMGELRFRQGRHAEALTTFEKAIAAREASGQPVPENWKLFALQSAVNAKMWPKAATLSRALVSTSPSPTNWRNAISIYRSSTTLDAPGRVDVFRLMRATKSFENANDYLALGDLLARGRFYAESQQVIQEGFASGKLPRSNRDAATILAEVGGRVSSDLAALPGLETRAKADSKGALALNVADGYYGHGNYAKAAEYYRLAIQKGGIDSGLANLRLGMAFANAGQRAEAEAAFKAVSGPRAGLASYWLLWLSQRG